MPKCGYCKSRKGKRQCPVLGSICSACCGEHRRKDIDCPAGCVYLKDEDVSPAAAFPGALSDLLRFAFERRDLGDALHRLWLGSTGKLPRAQSSGYAGYLAYGVRDERGRRMVDRYLDERGGALRPVEVEALRALDRAWASFFEVVAVRPGQGVHVLDLLAGRELAVADPALAEQLVPGGLVLAWIVPLGKEFHCTGAILPVPEAHLPGMAERLDAWDLSLAVEAGEAGPGELPRLDPGAASLPAGLPPVLLPAIYRAQASGSAYEMYTEAGHEVEPATALYQFEPSSSLERDLAADLCVIATAPGRYLLRAAPDSFEDPVAAIRVEAGRLELRAFSRDALSRARAWVELRYASLVRHRQDDFGTVDEAIDAPEPEPRPPDEDLGAPALDLEERTYQGLHALPLAGHERLEGQVAGRPAMFQVEDATLWLLDRTELEAAGAALVLPFPSLGLLITDRPTLELAERQAGGPLVALSAYASIAPGGAAGERVLRLSLILDGGPQVEPRRIARELAIAESEPLAQSVARLAEPSPELSRLVKLVLSAILFAGSRSALARKLAPAPGLDEHQEEFVVPGRSREEFFHLSADLLPGLRATLGLLQSNRVSGVPALAWAFAPGGWRAAPAQGRDLRPIWIPPSVAEESSARPGGASPHAP